MTVKIILIITSLIFISIKTYSQNVDRIINENLSTYNDLIQSDSIQSKISDGFENKRVFFIAETHELAINTNYQFFFLKYLHEYANVRNLITEYSYGTSLLIDKYLNTGDTIFLQAIPNNKYELFREYWNKIYLWNKNLPTDQHISIYGVGRFNWPIIAPIYFCLPDDKEMPEELKSEISIVKQLYESNSSPSYYGDEFDSKDNQKLRKSLRRKLQKYPELKSYFGSNYIHVKKIVNNHAAYKPTDVSMFKNFNELQDNIKGNLMIVFGSYHCFLDRWEHKYDPLAKLINESADFRNQVFSTFGYFDNCTSARGITIYDDGLKPFQQTPQNDLLIDKAFDNSNFSILNLINIPKGLLLNSIQYADLLFIMKNQKPVY